MKIHLLSEEELLKLAADNRWINASARYEAIAVLGEKGTLVALPTLENTAPWLTVDTGADLIQQQYIKTAAQGAIRSIKMRSWSESDLRQSK